ncbi:hypothetical protein BDFB_008812 [Asbolus verrucosus]|uniref:Uncharacterized protein n=1 Tax=Asbolus verrucosus TaxID=1661398 RepID=A0A482VYT3_ASBVE|nr:hypothetical protein BDFB_008812 [Asbolus verrucosus]
MGQQLIVHDKIYKCLWNFLVNESLIEMDLSIILLQLQQRSTEKIHKIKNTPALLHNVFSGTKRRVRKY